MKHESPGWVWEQEKGMRGKTGEIQTKPII